VVRFITGKFPNSPDKDGDDSALQIQTSVKIRSPGLTLGPEITCSADGRVLALDSRMPDAGDR
jgi:hypothetical protein